MPLKTSAWNIVNSGALSGPANMEIDRRALEALMSGADTTSTLRFFQWEKPVVTFGYLMNPEWVTEWKAKLEIGESKLEVVKRPTGGGAVLHTADELSLSLLWPRSAKHFSATPRDCYAEIHRLIKESLEEISDSTYSLKMPSGTPSCAPTGRFSACFQEPVCNDVMSGAQKIAGGALRVTQKAILYQGSLQVPGGFDVETFKKVFSDRCRHGR